MNLQEITIANIVTLCQRITNETEADAFFDYAGHVQGITVSLFANGWSEGAYRDYRTVIYIDREDAQKQLNSIYEYLKYFLNEKLAAKGAEFQ